MYPTVRANNETNIHMFHAANMCRSLFSYKWMTMNILVAFAKAVLSDCLGSQHFLNDSKHM